MRATSAFARLFNSVIASGACYLVAIVTLTTQTARAEEERPFEDRLANERVFSMPVMEDVRRGMLDTMGLENVRHDILLLRATTGQVPNPYNIYRLAQYEFLAGETEAGLFDINRAILAMPKEAMFYSARAAEYARRNELDHAIEDAQKSIQLNIGLEEPYMILGHCFQEKSDPKAACESVEKAFKIMKERTPRPPELHGCMISLGFLYGQLGRFDEAESIYKNALHLAKTAALPNFSQVPDHVANTLPKPTDMKEGQIAMLIARLGFIHMSQGRKKLAESEFKEALSMMEKQKSPVTDVGVSGVLSKLGDLYFQSKRYAEAEATLVRSIDLIRDNPYKSLHRGEIASSENTLGMVYYRLGRYDDAAPMFESAIKSSAAHSAPWDIKPGVPEINLATVYTKQKKYSLAIPLFEKNMTLLEKSLGSDHESLTNARRNLAECYIAEGKPELAVPLNVSSEKGKTKKNK